MFNFFKTNFKFMSFATLFIFLLLSDSYFYSIFVIIFYIIFAIISLSVFLSLKIKNQLG